MKRAVVLVALAGLVGMGVMPLAGCLIIVDKEVERSPDGERAKSAIGVNIDRIDAATATQLNLDRDKATLITYVAPGSAAEKAGLKKYDIVTVVDGSDCAPPSRVREAIKSHRHGEELHLSVVREGKAVDVTVCVE
jgi:serine protease Do